MLTLTGGRQLGYGSFGAPDGRPVIYCHGYPGNRIEFELIDRVLHRHDVPARVVVLDRPGYGNSAPVPQRGLLGWPRDVVEAADLLGLDEFAVLGVSGRGPFALACAHELPDRVSKVGIAVGLGPPGGRAAALEAGLYRTGWGFDPENIASEAHLWYGGQDEMVPASVGEWLAARLPNAHYTCWRDHGHMTWMDGPEAAEVIATITGLHE